MNKALGAVKFHVLEDDAAKLGNVRKMGIAEKAAVFGELQNRNVVRSVAAKDAIQKEIKLQDVKPRIDTRWTKSQVNAANAAKAIFGQQKGLTRTQSLRTAANAQAKITTNGVTAAARRASGQENVVIDVDKKVTTTTKTAVTAKQEATKVAAKKVVKAVVQQKVAAVQKVLRREDSNLSQKSLAKFKALASRNDNTTKNVGVVKPLQTTVTAATKAEQKVLSKPTKKIETNLKQETTTKTSSSSTTNTTTTITVHSHSRKLLSNVEDIDAGDEGNLVLVSEYVNDIYEYLFQLEIEQPVHVNHLEHQLEITPRMRAVLIDWINEVHVQFHLQAETYHMTVAIIDRYLQLVSNTKRSNLQLVGVTALFIAAKYEELFPPSVADFAYITDDAYDSKTILRMELEMFKALDCNLSRPLSIHFLRRFSKAGKAEESHHTAAKYFLELASIEYELAHFRPSEIAAASLFLSLHIFNEDANVDSGFNAELWTPTLEYYSTYNAKHLHGLVKKIASLASGASKAKLDAVYRKYESPKFQKISQRPELSGALINSIVNDKVANKSESSQ